MSKQLNLFGSENPEEAILESNELGYQWLVDLPSGEHELNGNQISTPYIPYRIKFPSGKILDQREVFYEIPKLEKMGFSKEEITNARTLERAIHNPGYNLTEKYKFSGCTFVSQEDMLNTIKKYFEKPFWKN